MRKGSIAASLFWLAAAWLVIALAGTAVLLTELYGRALDTHLSDQLRFTIETLIGGTLDSTDPRFADVAVPDPRFERAATGWYWVIRDGDGQVLTTSPSVVGIVAPAVSGPFDADNYRAEITGDEAGHRLRGIERATISNSRLLRILVTGSLDDNLALIDEFRRQALTVLGAVALALAVMSAILTRFAMRPLDRLGRAIEAVREGDATAIVGAYPREIAPLAEEINELLRANTQIIERARNAVGNLAHGLKTPLAVIRNEAAASDAPLGQVIGAEAEKMTQLVATYLDRARLAARSSVVGKKTDTVAVLTRLVRVMEKLYPRISVALTQAGDTSAWFRGDEGDLEEMAGNLLDNACKWGRDRVTVTLGADRGAVPAAIVLLVEDDGPGLTEEEARKVLRRGVRLDEKTPGSGLGLDIVKELVDVYGGELNLRRSPRGGLAAELKLPAARPAGNRG